MSKLIKLSLFAASLILLAWFGTSYVYADPDFVPVYYPGGTLQSPSAITYVSMDYEKVTLSLTEINDDYPVHVSGIFKMRNNGSQTETMNVFFPASDERSWFNSEASLTNFKVNGKIIPESDIIQIPKVIDGDKVQLSAYQWQEIFIPQETLQIDIEYDTRIQNDYGYNKYELSYVLGTGRNWQGPIKQGEIVFATPKALPSWAIMLSSNIPMKISGNTITAEFSNYEPDDKEVVAVSFYYNAVAIEELRRKPQTFDNVLKLAELFTELTDSIKCSLCVGPIEDALRYYDLALDQAASKDELNSVLASFSGFNTEYILSILALKDCGESDMYCLASLYLSRDGLADSALRVNEQTGEVRHSTFLKKYAEKMRQYDPALADSVINFLSRVKEVSEWSKTHNYWDEPQPEEKQNTNSAVSKEIQKQQDTSSPVVNFSRWLQVNVHRRVIITCILLIIASLASLFLIRLKRPKS